MNAAMRFGHLGGSLEDQRLRRVKRSEVGRPASGFGEFDTGDSMRSFERLPCLSQILRGFRLHRSRPSRRISRISAVRSR
jgi:hypothetical protein